MKINAHMVFLLLFFVFGCRQQITQEHDHSHDPSELEILRYTLYSDKTELFVEFKPLISGETTRFNVHLTVLGDTFAPLTARAVSVSLFFGDEGIRATADTARTPGIYSPVLRPGSSGTASLVFDIATENYTDQFVIDDIVVYPDLHDAVHEQAHDHREDQLQYSKEQAWKIGLTNEPVIRQDFAHVIRASGLITAAQGDEVVISAKSGGIVKFGGNSVTVGSAVSAGARLFTISGGDITEGNIDASYQQIRATYLQAESNYNRAKELVADKIISKKAFLDAKLAFDNASTQYNLIGKNYSASGQSNVSPISGFVKSVTVSEGEYVNAGTPLAVISRNKKLVLQANVSKKHFQLLPSIASANFIPTGSETVYNTQALNGRVVSYGRSSEATTAFVPVLFEIDNTGDFIPGSAVQFFLKSSPIPDALVIPVSALMEEQGSFYVYVQVGGEQFEKHVVDLGEGDGMRVQVLSGLREGDRVVTKGAYQIRLANAGGSLPAHSHDH